MGRGGWVRVACTHESIARRSPPPRRRKGDVTPPRAATHIPTLLSRKHPPHTDTACARRMGQHTDATRRYAKVSTLDGGGSGYRDGGLAGFLCHASTWTGHLHAVGACKTLTVDVEIIEGRRPQAHRDAAHSRGPRALKDLDEEHLQPRLLCIGLAARQSGPLCGLISAQVREIWTNRGTHPLT